MKLDKIQGFCFSVLNIDLIRPIVPRIHLWEDFKQDPRDEIEGKIPGFMESEEVARISPIPTC